MNRVAATNASTIRWRILGATLAWWGFFAFVFLLLPVTLGKHIVADVNAGNFSVGKMAILIFIVAVYLDVSTICVRILFFTKMLVRNNDEQIVLLANPLLGSVLVIRNDEVLSWAEKRFLRCPEIRLNLGERSLIVSYFGGNYQVLKKYLVMRG